MTKRLVIYTSLLCLICASCAQKVAQSPRQILADSKEQQHPSHRRQTERLAEKTVVKGFILESLGLSGTNVSSNFGAYFILIDEDEVQYFSDLFRGNIPRVNLSFDRGGELPNLVKDEEGGFLDKITGKPAAILGFQKLQIKEDHAEVEMVESYSLLAVSIHNYDLLFKGGKWTIRNHTRKTVS